MAKVDVRAGERTLEALAKHGVKFSVANGDKEPTRKNYINDNEKISKHEKEYKRGNYFIAVLAKSDLFVVDIDKPDNLLSQKILDLAKAHDVWLARSQSKGVHLYFKRDRDSAAMFGDRQHFPLRASKRANAKEHIGDMIQDHVIAYKRVSGAIAPMPTGMFELLTHGSEPTTRKVERIYQDVSRQLGEANEGERNATMFRLMHELRRRLVGVGASDMIRERLGQLTTEYARINPDDASSFDERRIDEIMDAPCAAKPDDESDDIATAAVNAYLELHEHEVIISDATNDAARVVYEWDAITAQWTKKFLRKRSRAGNDGVAKVLCDLYRRMHGDRHNGKEPSGKQLHHAEIYMLSMLKRNHEEESALEIFDRQDGYVAKVRTEADNVLVIDTKENTTSFATNKADDYLLAATGHIGGKPSELWQNVLHDIFDGNKDIIEFVGRMVASALVPNKKPTFIICHGGGANGKSVFLKTLAKAFGDHAVECTPLAFVNPSITNDPKRQLDEREAMVGKRLAVCSESSDEPLDMFFLKAMTAQDKLPVGGMFKRNEKVRLHCLPIIATNDLPRLRNVSDAVRRRVLLLPFSVRFGGDGLPDDPLLELKLEDELPAIRRWIIDEVEKFVASGCELNVPDELLAKSDDYTQDQTHPIELKLKQWLHVLPRADGNMVLGRKVGNGKDAYHTGIMALAHWIHSQEDLQSKRPQKKQVKQWLAKRGITSDDRGRLNCEPTDELTDMLAEKDAPREKHLFAKRKRAMARNDDIDDAGDDNEDY